MVHLRIESTTDFTLTYAMNDNLSVIAGYDHFFTGGFFRAATGSSKDIDYGYLMLQFDFSKSKPKLKPVKGQRTELQMMLSIHPPIEVCRWCGITAITAMLLAANGGRGFLYAVKVVFLT